MTASDGTVETGINWGNVIIAILAGGLTGYVIYNIGMNAGVAKTKMILPATGGEKRYSVFLSSTYRNLIDERKEVRDIVSKAGYFANSMEGFPTADEDKIKFIESRIIESDYFVLIIGKRYGTLIPDKEISFTEYEHDYALKNNIPILTFILTDSDEEDDPEDDKDKLKTFLEKVERKMTRHCSMSELLSLIPISINHSIATKPRRGYVRGPELD